MLLSYTAQWCRFGVGFIKYIYKLLVIGITMSGIEFLEYLDRRKSESTTKKYAYWFRKFAYEKGAEAETVEEMQRKLIAFFEDHPNLPVSGMIKNLCAYLKIPKPPLDLSLIRKESKLPQYYQDGEAKKLLAAMDDAGHGLVTLLMLECGLRVSEAVGLRQDQCLLDEGRLLIRGKGSKERYVYVSPEALRRLRKQLVVAGEDTPWVFPSPATESHITPDAVRYHLRRIRSGAKPHTFRHTYATNLLRAGINLRTIQAGMGHADPKTTSIYTHVFDEDVQEASKAAWINNS